MKNFIQDGDNLTILSSLLIGLNSPPKSGDAVVCGRIVGVVNNDSAGATDQVVVSTRGVFNVGVQTVHNGISIGETVFIDPASGVLSDDFNDVPFGIALASISVGAGSKSIDVKLFGQTPGATGANS
jgi:predicted RecA/RadA family phage recombinase